MIKKTLIFLKRNGVKKTFKRIKSIKKRKYISKDILFIDGCGEVLPHPSRYRVWHQIEQLELCDISCDSVYFLDLNVSLAKYYRAFVIFRCPLTTDIQRLINFANRQNKVVVYDIDDLVIDTRYTNQIPYVARLAGSDKAAYDDNVKKMGEVLRKCDVATTSTERLSYELAKYISPVHINRNIASEKMVLLADKIERKDSDKQVILGYFSGSITHNADFEMILPVIVELMQERQNVYLKIVGDLDVPPQLNQYKERILHTPYIDWKKLPELVGSVDINLAPLTDTIFNEAKSEIKWIEAALVKVPTVASNIGAFKKVVLNKETGVLCSDIEEWKQELSWLIDDRHARQQIGERAYEYVKDNCTSLATASKYASIMKGFFPKSIAFVVPAIDISGGIRVILKHGEILRRQGFEVVILTLASAKEDELSISETVTNRHFDVLVATMWSTVDFVINYGKAKRKCYLVQNFETGFYDYGNPYRIAANSTYFKESLEYLTISKWCQGWLQSDCGQKVRYAPNGIDTRFICESERDYSGKIRILIEGDSDAAHKNVDESFMITNSLDRNKFEIWYMSYNGKAKEWYIYDKFLHKIPYNEVVEVYRACHILLKTSLLESFSYPPLEMMATGGQVVAIQNGGNREYLVDGENCLIYKQGDIDAGVEAIKKIVDDAVLRSKLFINGIEVAKKHQWDQLEKDIVSLYVEKVE